MATLYLIVKWGISVWLRLEAELDKMPYHPIVYNSHMEVPPEWMMQMVAERKQASQERQSESASA